MDPCGAQLHLEGALQCGGSRGADADQRACAPRTASQRGRRIHHSSARATQSRGPTRCRTADAVPARTGKARGRPTRRQNRARAAGAMKRLLQLDDHRLIICLGPGGVGKTTISAALALYGAMEGRSVDVMTVDPAPRLLDALGLDASSSEPQPVPLEGIIDRNGRRPHPRLRGLKLDPKATFDALVNQYAPSKAARDAILGNRIYRNLSGALSGVGDYMAMEKLLELYRAPDADLIVL